MNDLEAQLQTATADLKYAQKRIESLQGALTAEGAGTEDEEEDESYNASPKHRQAVAPLRGGKKKALESEGESSDGSYRIGQFAGSSSDDEEMTRLDARKKQREKERFNMKDDNLDDIDDKYISKERRKKVSIDDNLSVRKIEGGRADLQDDLDDDITPKKKYNWRELLSDDENEPAVSKPRARKNFDISDDDQADVDVPSKGRKRYDSSDNDDLGTGRTDKSRSSWKSKIDLSDDEDMPIRKTLSKTKVNLDSDEEYKPKRSYKKYLDDEDSLDETKKIKDVIDKSSKTKKKSWETSSEEEDYKPRSRNTKLSSYLSEDDDVDIPRSRSKKSLDFISDDDDMPILKHAPKLTTDQSPSTKEERISPSRKENVKFDVNKEDDNESFKSSRRRRDRRRSHLSNTGTSPEDSPKRSSAKK